MDILAPFPTFQPQLVARRRRHAAEPPLWHKIEKFIKFYETDLFCSKFYLEFNKNVNLYQKMIFTLKKAYFYYDDILPDSMTSLTPF